jgi:phosphate/sulfate permease
MNDFLAFSQQYYWLLLLPLTGVAIAHFIVFVSKRLVRVLESPSHSESNELSVALGTTQRTKHVAELRSERVRLRAELDLVDAQLAKYESRVNLRQQAI